MTYKVVSKGKVYWYAWRGGPLSAMLLTKKQTENWTVLNLIYSLIWLSGSMTPLELKHQRKSLGLSQAALADLLGCHKQAVHYWETGKRPIPAMLELAMQALRIRSQNSDQ